MAVLINLGAKRKDKARVAARAQADANATKFGRTKAEKALQSTKAEKERRDLDGAKRE